MASRFQVVRPLDEHRSRPNSKQDDCRKDPEDNAENETSSGPPKWTSHPLFIAGIVILMVGIVAAAIVIPCLIFLKNELDETQYRYDAYYRELYETLPDCRLIPAAWISDIDQSAFIRFQPGPCRDQFGKVVLPEGQRIEPLYDVRPMAGQSYSTAWTELPTRNRPGSAKTRSFRTRSLEISNQFLSENFTLSETAPSENLTSETLNPFVSSLEEGDPDRDLHHDANLEESNPLIPVWDASKPLQYTFGDSFTNTQKTAIRAAMEQWSKETCLKYTEVKFSKSLRNTIIINKTNDELAGGFCYWQDKITGNQLIEFSASTLAGQGEISVMTHEFGHSLGIMHDHQRPDREVTVKPENMISRMKHELNPMWGIVDGTPYDPSSIMHYRAVAYSKEPTRLLVMEPWNPDQLNIMGNYMAPTFNDVKKVNLHYQCPKMACGENRLPRRCQHGGYQDPKNCSVCRCPTGLSGRFCEGLEPSRGFGPTQCGGLIELKPCQSTTLYLPTYPLRFPFDAKCTWVVKSESCNLQMAFEEKPQMQCYYNYASGMCVDWLEIRSNFDNLDIPGKFFCACSEVEGRKILIQGGLALIRFISFPEKSHKWDGRGNGFKLTVQATCKLDNRTLKEPEQNCRIAESGSDILYKPNVPYCGKDGPAFVVPLRGADVQLPKPRSSCETYDTSNVEDEADKSNLPSWLRPLANLFNL